MIGDEEKNNYQSATLYITLIDIGAVTAIKNKQIII